MWSKKIIAIIILIIIIVAIIIIFLLDTKDSLFTEPIYESINTPSSVEKFTSFNHIQLNQQSCSMVHGSYSKGFNDYPTSIDPDNKLSKDICPNSNQDYLKGTCVWNSEEEAKKNCDKISQCYGFHKHRTDDNKFVGFGKRKKHKNFSNNRTSIYNNEKENFKQYNVNNNALSNIF